MNDHVVCNTGKLENVWLVFCRFLYPSFTTLIIHVGISSVRHGRICSRFCRSYHIWCDIQVPFDLQTSNFCHCCCSLHRLCSLQMFLLQSQWQSSLAFVHISVLPFWGRVSWISRVLHTFLSGSSSSLLEIYSKSQPHLRIWYLLRQSKNYKPLTSQIRKFDQTNL